MAWSCPDFSQNGEEHNHLRLPKDGSSLQFTENKLTSYQPLQIEHIYTKEECLLIQISVSCKIQHSLPNSSNMKKIDVILRKCKSFSIRIGRSNSYTSLRSKSNREESLIWEEETLTSNESDEKTIVFVGSSRRPYVISSKHLNHPLLTALIERSRLDDEVEISVKCEVVLFDHLLWMIENADLEGDADGSAVRELAELYVY
ncbi:hypothetical protein LUZ60_005117 [Juncus effusus]|nr:hypothetical protein LUZ60_005117 [Juncus effusus]